MQSRTLGNSSIRSPPWTEQHSTPNSHPLAKPSTSSRSTNPFQSAPTTSGKHEGRLNGPTTDQSLGSRTNVSPTTDERALEDNHRRFSKMSISRPDDEDHVSIGTSSSEMDAMHASSRASSPERGPKGYIPKHSNDLEGYMKVDQERIAKLEELVRNLSAQVMKGKEETHRAKSVPEDAPQSSSAFVFDGDHSRIKDMRISIPSLNFLTQDEWKALDGKPIPSVHYAIDVLVEVSNPTTDGTHPGERLPAMDLSAIDLDAMAWLDERELSQVQQSDLKELPEKIRINSRRLQCLLDHDLWDGSLNYASGQPYTILRPFKILIYQEAKIRQRLYEFEEARQQSSPQTGEEYLNHFKSDPAPDDAPRERQDLSSMTISELTGAINDFQCLVKFIDDYIKPVQHELQDRPRQVRFSNLWYLFPPGSLIYVKDKNIPQKIWKVIQRTGGRRFLSRPDLIREGQFQNKYTPFLLDCYHLDFDGSGFVQTFGKFSITKFDDVLNISSLPVIPFQTALKEKLTSREELETRGQQFTYCTELRHQYYSGRSQYRAPNGRKFSLISGIENSGNVTIFSETIESQVMIDFERALQEVPDWRPGLEELKPQVADVCEYEDVFGGKLDRDTVWDTRFTDEFMETESAKWRKWKSGVNIPSSDLLLLPDRVFGFVFRSRKWACLQLGLDNNREEQLRNIVPNPRAWNDLELLDGHKHVIQSLIHSHFDKKQKGNRVEYDLVRDKGKGVILLLHGVPGVGKTSTAECVAESTERPLLPITCGDLGLSPKDVETNLQSAFRLAEAWDCVLLLDEADIFLDQRSTGDIERNSLVSVFLRVLEYYDGILFLTTNRVGTFDEAFKSRIHMALYYPPLNWHQTEKIWRSLIRRTREQNSQVECDESELVQYAQELFEVQKNGAEVGPVWNGRQLRNAFQSAIALAGFNNSSTGRISLQKQHFQKVADVSHHFNNYLWRVKKGQSDGEIMSRNMIRHDKYDPVSIGTPSQQNTASSFSASHNSLLPRATFAGQNPARVPSPAPTQGLPVTQVLSQQSQHFVNPNSFQQPQTQFQQTTVQPQTYWNPTQMQAQQLQPQQFQQQQPALYNPALQYASYPPVSQFQSPSQLPQQGEQISQASQQQQPFGGYPQNAMPQQQGPPQSMHQSSQIQQQSFNVHGQERPLYQQVPHRRGQSQDSGIGTDIPGGNPMSSSGQLGTVVDSPRTSPQAPQVAQFGTNAQQH